jgi:hypothetical protein
MLHLIMSTLSVDALRSAVNSDSGRLKKPGDAREVNEAMNSESSIHLSQRLEVERHSKFSANVAIQLY